MLAGTKVTATVSVGTRVAAFDVSTAALVCTQASAITLVAQTGAPLNTQVESAAVTIAGLGAGCNTPVCAVKVKAVGCAQTDAGAVVTSNAVFTAPMARVAVVLVPTVMALSKRTVMMSPSLTVPATAVYIPVLIL